MSENSGSATSTMASTPGRDMTSDIFELITDDDTRFYVHSDVLTSQSTPFHLAVTGPWKEATERRILLADWDTDTVSRLVEFLYTGDYAYPNPIPLGDSLAPERSIAPKPENTTTGPAEAELDSNRPLTPFSTCLRNHLRPNRAPRVPDVQRLGPFDPAEFDYAAVLLAHARVYVLANYKAVEYLQTLALKRVQLVLSRLQPLITDSQTTGNVAEFAEYVYANTSQLSVSEEPLRKITSLFIALNMVDFHSEGRAVALMAKGGDLVTDVMAKLRRRMLDPDDPCSSSSPLRGRYISYIAIVSGESWCQFPCTVQEKNGDGNINASSEDFHCSFLAVEYTDSAKDACTRFEVTRSPIDPNSLSGLRKSLKIVGIKDENECAKVTDVCLVRRDSCGGLDFEAMKEYDGMSDNVSFGSDTIYLLWKTVRTAFV